MQITHSLRATLAQLQRVLVALSNDEYATPLQILSHASIGQHIRHVIEFFQVLVTSYEAGTINYDKRKRNKLLESSRDCAHQELSSIIDGIALDDKEVFLISSLSVDSTDVHVKSTYYREVVYNLEHAIHHMAIIRIGILHSTNLTLPDDFGVAPATIQYQKSTH